MASTGLRREQEACHSTAAAARYTRQPPRETPPPVLILLIHQDVTDQNVPRTAMRARPTLLGGVSGNGLAGRGTRPDTRQTIDGAEPRKGTRETGTEAAVGVGAGGCADSAARADPARWRCAVPPPWHHPGARLGRRGGRQWGGLQQGAPGGEARAWRAIRRTYPKMTCCFLLCTASLFRGTSKYKKVLI